MEKRRRSGDRSNRAHKNPSGHGTWGHRDYRHPGRERHEIAADAVSESTRDIATNHIHHSRTLQISSTTPQDDYVQNWLAQTARELAPPRELSALKSKKERGSYSLCLKNPLQPPDFRAFLQANDDGSHDERERACHKRGKHALETSSNSSFIEPWLAPEPRLKPREILEMTEDMTTKRSPARLYKRRKLVPCPASSERCDSRSTARQREETFEKRRRHKTREDRYDPNKAAKRSEFHPAIEKENHEVKTKKSRRKALKKNGEDLMQNFTSERVAHNRLTIRPSHTPGLFKNGRASRPARRRGLSDLTFSEMDFLQRPKQRPPDSNDKKVVSKSREKEKRKSQRAQNEISEFFNLDTKPLAEITGNGKPRRRAKESKDSHNRIFSRKQFINDRHRSSYSMPTSHSIDFRDVGLGREGRTFAKVLPQQRQCGLPGSEILPEIISRLSDRATTYYTWSESVRSPSLTEQKQNTNSRVSTTPEAVRRSLEDTGIFRSTGIERTFSRRYETNYQEPDQPGVQHADSRRSALPKHMSSPEHKDKRSSSVRGRGHWEDAVIDNDRRVYHIRNHGQTDEKPTTYPITAPEVNREHDWECLQRPGISIELCDIGSGWKRDAAEVGSVEQPQRVSTTETTGQVTSRRVFAQGAYVNTSLARAAATQMAKNANRAILSVDRPETVAASHSGEQHTETMNHTEIMVETPHRRLLVSNGPTERVKGGKLARKAAGSRSLGKVHGSSKEDHSSSNTSASNPVAEYAPNAVPATDKQADTSPGAQGTTCIPDICNQEVPEPQDTEWSSSETYNQGRAGPKVFAGLPVRGPSSSRNNDLPSQLHVRSPRLPIEPLYSFQLGNQKSHDFVDLRDDQNRLGVQRLRPLDNHLVDHPLNQEVDVISEIFEAEQFDEASEQQREGIFYPDPTESSPFFDGEEAHLVEWESNDPALYYHDGAQQRQHEEANFSSLFSEQQSTVTSADLHEYVEYHQYSHQPVRQFARQEQDTIEEDMRLTGFWRPYRQY